MTKSGESERCVALDWTAGWFPYRPARPVFESWHGSMIEGKRDGSGLLYRRNRYYDPGSGRFTQEDPIGLAGGLNLYGYAGGDPVNFRDPFGLDCMDANGNRIPCSPLPVPLQLARLVNRSTLQPLQPETTRGSGFVMRTRSDGSRYQHQGLDLRASPGIEVYAMYDGVVTQAVASDDGNSAGLRVTIRSSNADGETTSYWHLSSVYVQEGDVVTGGQPIGTTGTSGNANPRRSGREPHLHLRKQVNGRDVDPGVLQ
jgi:RHS repeat-associated protein